MISPEVELEYGLHALSRAFWLAFIELM